MAVKRRIFITFDHDDTELVNGFLGLRNISDSFDFYNHKLDHRIRSSDDEYVARVIREEYIQPASVVVALIGNKTAQSTWVKREIREALRQGKGVLGIRLPGTNGPTPEGIPPNAVGDWQPDNFPGWIEWAYEQRKGTVSAT